MSKVHVIKDENLGGVLREFVEVDRKAEVGEFVIRNGVVRKVTQRDPLPGSVGFEGYYEEGCDDKIIGWSDGTYKTLEPTDIVHIDGQRYRMVERKAKVGDKIVIVNPLRCQFGASYTQGTIMTVENVYEDGNVYCGKFDLIDKDEYQTIEPTSDEKTSPTVHEMLANLSEQIVKLNRRIDRLADANEQAVSTVARDVERVDADLIKLRKEFEDSKDVKLTLSSELVAKLIKKGLSD